MTVIDKWEADPSWPPEQQLLFRRLSERFATHLGLKAEAPAVRHTEEEERQILEKISATDLARGA